MEPLLLFLTINISSLSLTISALYSRNSCDPIQALMCNWPMLLHPKEYKPYIAEPHSPQPPWVWGLKSGLAKQALLPLEPHFQYILLWLFWR
jgi:hypothetical protein